MNVMKFYEIRPMQPKAGGKNRLKEPISSENYIETLKFER